MAPGSAPLVAVSTYSVDADWKVWATTASLTPNTYLERLDQAGAVPILLPSRMVSMSRVDQLLDAVQAVVLIGGEDICGVPEGRAEAAEAHAAHNPERDAFEVALAQRAWERDIPLLGICRGMQVLNVARGGTLIENLPGAGTSSEHLIERGVFNSHAVDVSPGTKVSELFGERVLVPSHHHQAVDHLGEGLTVSGRASDSVIEAVEAPTKGFFLGVQWHPEESEDLTLFEALVEATAVRA